VASPENGLARREKKDAMVVVFVEGVSGVATGDFDDVGCRKYGTG